MTETAHASDHLEEPGEHAPYITLFFILLNFTTMEYFYAQYHGQRGLALILCGTTIFLTIVTGIFAAIFKFEFSRKWAYLTLVPAFILAIFPVPLVLGLMVLAVTKATLVGLYFMHLKYEGNWVYFMLVPAGILAMVFIFALYPDIGMQPTDEELNAQGADLSMRAIPQPYAPG